MDIVRRYDRPQSSTSELLSSLVDLGLLYKNPVTRSYTLTARAGLLGAAVQPEMVRDGRLTLLMDELVDRTGLCVALFGMINLRAQIFSWRCGDRLLPADVEDNFHGGRQERLSETAAGWMLLSTVDGKRRDAMIRHMQAEAQSDPSFTCAEIREAVEHGRRDGFAIGPAGFESNAEICSVLLPESCGQPMALGFVYEPSAQYDSATMVDTLREAVADLERRNEEELAHQGRASERPLHAVQQAPEVCAA